MKTVLGHVSLGFKLSLRFFYWKPGVYHAVFRVLLFDIKLIIHPIKAILS